MFSPLAEVLSRNCDGTDGHSTPVKVSLSKCFRYVKNSIYFMYLQYPMDKPLKDLI